MDDPILNFKHLTAATASSRYGKHHSAGRTVTSLGSDTLHSPDNCRSHLVVAVTTAVGSAELRRAAEVG